MDAPRFGGSTSKQRRGGHDVRRWALLCDLADMGSVSAVAEDRGVSSSAVSQQLHSLEDEVGRVLLRRDGRRLSLTPSGNVLVEHARKALSAIDAAWSSVMPESVSLSGTVTVSGSSALPVLAVPTMRRLQNKHPEITVHVVQTTGADSLHALRRRDIDLAITSDLPNHSKLPFSGVATERVMYDPLVILAPTALHERLRVDGLIAAADHSWVTGASGSQLHLAVVNSCATAGFVPRIQQRVVGGMTMCELASTSNSITVVPRLSVPKQHEHLLVRGIDLGGRDILIAQRHSTADPALQALVRELKVVCAELTAE
ncbi:hypothetical protein CH267_12905 [Rhodococcus sp. 06-621-2]|nr:hypothetical protein CH267_12905 [Rhodococcus sp. 06-621-2]